MKISSIYQDRGISNAANEAIRTARYDEIMQRIAKVRAAENTSIDSKPAASISTPAEHAAQETQFTGSGRAARTMNDARCKITAGEQMVKVGQAMIQDGERVISESSQIDPESKAAPVRKKGESIVKEGMCTIKKGQRMIADAMKMMEEVMQGE